MISSGTISGVCSDFPGWTWINQRTRWIVYDCPVAPIFVLGPGVFGVTTSGGIVYR